MWCLAELVVGAGEGRAQAAPGHHLNREAPVAAEEAAAERAAPSTARRSRYLPAPDLSS
jgi:hypothetical protein